MNYVLIAKVLKAQVENIIIYIFDKNLK